MIPFPIDTRLLILEKEIPKNTKKVVVVTYRKKSIVVPVDMYDSGEYRMEFIKAFGFPPPSAGEVSEVFSPNIHRLIKET